MSSWKDALTKIVSACRDCVEVAFAVLSSKDSSALQKIKIKRKGGACWVDIDFVEEMVSNSRVHGDRHADKSATKH